MQKYLEYTLSFITKAITLNVQTNLQYVREVEEVFSRISA